jgi:spore coat protein JC
MLFHKLTKNASSDLLVAAGLGVIMWSTTTFCSMRKQAGFRRRLHIFRKNAIQLRICIEDIASEEKARATYQWLINLTDDVELQGSSKFLWEYEVVHCAA